MPDVTKLSATAATPIGNYTSAKFAGKESSEAVTGGRRTLLGVGK